MSIFDATYNNAPQTFTISSSNRTSGTNESFQNPPLNLDLSLYDSVVLLSVDFCKSYFNFPSGYNTFILQENTSQILITIPAGTMSKNNIMPVLASLMTNASLNNITYSVTYPPISQADTYRFTFTSSGSIQPSFIFDINAPYKQLGFSIGTYSFTSSSLVSPNAINFQYIQSINISSTICSDNNGILTSISNMGAYPFQSIIHYEENNIDLATRTLSSSNGCSWNWTLQNADNTQVVNLNGIPWIARLCVFQRNTTHQIHRQDLILSNEERKLRLEQEQQRVMNETKTLLNASIGNASLANTSIGNANPEDVIHYPLK